MAPRCLPAPSGLSGQSCFREPLPSSLGHSLVLELSFPVPPWGAQGPAPSEVRSRARQGVPSTESQAPVRAPLTAIRAQLRAFSGESGSWAAVSQGIGGCRFWGARGFPQQHLRSPPTNGELGGLLLQGPCLCIVTPLGRGCPHPCPSEQLGTCFPDCAFLVPTRPNLSQQASREVPGQEGRGLGLLLPFHVARAGCPPLTSADGAARRAWQSCPLACRRLGPQGQVWVAEPGSGRPRKTIPGRT